MLVWLWRPSLHNLRMFTFVNDRQFSSFYYLETREQLFISPGSRKLKMFPRILWRVVCSSTLLTAFISITILVSTLNLKDLYTIDLRG